MTDETPDNGCLTVIVFALIVSLIIVLALFGAAALLMPEV